MSKRQRLDAYLAEIFRQFIAIKDDDFKRAQEVFKSVFDQVRQKMGEQCNYFSKYSKQARLTQLFIRQISSKTVQLFRRKKYYKTERQLVLQIEANFYIELVSGSQQVLYAGSVYDGIKVSKMDEFDMDIVIKLPISYDDGPNGIVLENDQPGFVRLKITHPFDNLDKQQHWEQCHKVTRDWRDSDKYLLQNKFRHWLHGIVSKAMNELKGKVDVNGTIYLVTYKESGPAYTLNIRNDVGNEEFALDVDLVPVIRFMLPRWPEGYKMIEGTQVRDWLVVPKPNKAIKDCALKNRCWRLSFQDYEREMMKGCEALKTTIRLVKKLRDGLELKGIASYYIKTLFLWEIDQAEDKSYWRNKISVTFRGMVEKLYIAVKSKTIPYFWHKENNLLEGVKPTLLKAYEVKLKEVLDAIDANNVEKVVEYILTPEEMTQFKSSEFYKSVKVTVAIPSPNLSKQNSLSSENSGPRTGGILAEGVRALNDELDSLRDTFAQHDKMAQFEKRLTDLEDKVMRLEMAMKKMAFNKNIAEALNGISLDGDKTNASMKSVDELLINYE